MNKSTNADRSIAAYDAYVFASVGRSFDANKADTLAAVAVVDCEIAMRNYSEPKWLRDSYKATAAYFRAIV